MAEKDILYFPKCLYGTGAATKRSWGKYAHLAWKSRTWKPVFSDLDMVPVDSFAGDIFFQRGRIVEAKEARWRLYPIPWTLFDIAVAERKRDPDAAPAICEVMDGLHVEGAKQLWYTLGILGEPELLTFLYQRKWAEVRDRVYRPLVDSFVYWLPELCLLSRRLAAGMPRSAMGDTLDFVWVSHLLCIFWRVYHCDFEMSDFRPYVGDPIGGMLCRGLICERDGRYYPNPRLRLREG